MRCKTCGSFWCPADSCDTEAKLAEAFAELARAMEHWGRKDYEGLAQMGYEDEHALLCAVANYFDDMETSRLGSIARFLKTQDT